MDNRSDGLSNALQMCNSRSDEKSTLQIIPTARRERSLTHAIYSSLSTLQYLALLNQSITKVSADSGAREVTVMRNVDSYYRHKE